MGRITLLGTGLIRSFYTQALHGNRSRDRVGVVYSRSEQVGCSYSHDKHGTGDLRRVDRCRDRVVFVVMALGTAHRQTQKHFGRRPHTVGSVIHQIFFWDGAAFVGDHVISIETGSHFLIDS